MAGKKTKLGMDVKPRTREQIDQEYAQLATYAGHKGRLISQLDAEINNYYTRMVELTVEMQKTPPTAPPTTPPEPVAA